MQINPKNGAHSDDSISLQNPDIKEFKILLEKITKKYKTSGFELLHKIQEEEFLPISVFCKELSPLETVVKYLKENKNYSNKIIARATNRSEKTTWQAYSSSAKKHPGSFSVKFSKYDAPLSDIQNRTLSVLESVVVHLKQNFSLKFSQIAIMLHRDQRTIWTAFARAQKKVKNG